MRLNTSTIRHIIILYYTNVPYYNHNVYYHNHAVLQQALQCEYYDKPVDLPTTTLRSRFPRDISSVRQYAILSRFVSLWWFVNKLIAKITKSAVGPRAVAVVWDLPHGTAVERRAYHLPPPYNNAKEMRDEIRRTNIVLCSRRVRTGAGPIVYYV